MNEPVGSVLSHMKLLDKVVGWVAVSSIKLEDDRLVALASVCKAYREAVLRWLTTATAGEVLQVGTTLSPFMAGFLVHRPRGM